MGFGSRSVSMMRYRIKGTIEGAFWDVVDDGVRRGAFKQVESPGDEIAFGWVSIEDFTDNSFGNSSYVRGNYIALGLRLDTVRVPPRVLEIQLKQESRKLLDQTGQRRLSAGQLRELKERLKETLKSQVFPSIQVFDLVWDTSKELVYLCTFGVKARERLEEHFKKCFGLTLIPLLAYIRAQELLAGKLESQVLEKLEPCSMVP